MIFFFGVDGGTARFKFFSLVFYMHSCLGCQAYRNTYSLNPEPASDGQYGGDEVSPVPPTLSEVLYIYDYVLLPFFFTYLRRQVSFGLPSLLEPSSLQPSACMGSLLSDIHSARLYHCDWSYFIFSITCFWPVLSLTCSSLTCSNQLIFNISVVS